MAACVVRSISRLQKAGDSTAEWPRNTGPCLRRSPAGIEVSRERNEVARRLLYRCPMLDLTALRGYKTVQESRKGIPTSVHLD